MNKILIISFIGIFVILGIFLFVIQDDLDDIKDIFPSSTDAKRLPLLEEDLVTYTSSTETRCVLNNCELYSYGGTRFAQDENGTWGDAGRVTSITQTSDDLSINYFGIKGQKSIVWEVGSIYNGNYFSMIDVHNNFPEISFSFPVEETDYGKKYTLNIMDIPLVNQPNIEFITLTYKSHSGFDVSDLDFQQKKIIVGKIMNLLFDDAKSEGFTITFNKTEKRIYSDAMR